MPRAGIEKGSFVDKKTGFHEIGDGLMVIDWLMEAGSDEGWGEDDFDPRTGIAAAGGGSGGGEAGAGSRGEGRGTPRRSWATSRCALKKQTSP